MFFYTFVDDWCYTKFSKNFRNRRHFIKKKNWLTLLGIGAIGAGAYTYIRQKTGRSLSSVIVHSFLYAMDMQEKSEALVKEKPEEMMKKLAERNAELVSNPFSTFFNNHQEWLVDGMQVMDWKSNGSPDQNILIYFHGGGYVFQPWSTQFLAIDNIARKTNSRVIMPIYPKAPQYTFKDAFPKLGKLYRQILSEIDESAQISIIGDSAGGGLALGFNYYLIDEDLRQPDHLVLICPWLDLENSHPDLKEAMKKEAFFGMEGIEAAAKLWAGDEKDRKHPYASPKYGDLTKINGHITVFTGTDEALSVDIYDMIEKLKELDIDFDYEIKENQLHVYPLYPTVEGADARDKISAILNGDEE